MIRRSISLSVHDLQMQKIQETCIMYVANSDEITNHGFETLFVGFVLMLTVLGGTQLAVICALPTIVYMLVQMVIEPVFFKIHIFYFKIHRPK